MAADDADARRTLDRMGDKGLNTIGTLGNAVRHIASCVDRLKIDAQEARSDRDAIRKALAEMQGTLRDVGGDLRRLRERQQDHDQQDEREFQRLWKRIDEGGRGGNGSRQAEAVPFAIIRLGFQAVIMLIGALIALMAFGNERVAQILMQFFGDGGAPPA